MKVLRCRACHDGVSLTWEAPHSLSGRSAGRLLPNGGALLVGPAGLVLHTTEGVVEGREGVDIRRPIVPVL